MKIFYLAHLPRRRNSVLSDGRAHHHISNNNKIHTAGTGERKLWAPVVLRRDNHIYDTFAFTKMLLEPPFISTTDQD